MDKSSYESYEYLPATNNENMDTSQLLVVQEDGTFLCFNRPIQYVTQVDEVDAKEVLQGVQPCDVYNVAQQQLYIDGENSSELMSVSDQFIIPNEENNMYENNYLLQEDENAKEVQMDQDEPVQYKEVTESEETVVNDTEAEATVNKNIGECTEITLSDDEYKLLQEKGWILLESSDNTFLLDSSGLHDISADKKLIKKLKCELQDDTGEGDVSSTLKQEAEETHQDNSEIKQESTQSEVDSTPDEMVHYVIEDEGAVDEIENYHNDEQDISKSDIIEEGYVEVPELNPVEIEHDYVKLNSVKDSYAKKQNDTLRIKTKFSFRDIPPEIVLGKFNGKKLVARVVKTDKSIHDTNMRSRLGNNAKDLGHGADQPCFTALEDSKFENLVREAIRGTIECGVKDVTGAEVVVSQLLRVPAFKPAVMERRLIITKLIILEDEMSEPYSESNPTLVTGRAVRDSNNECHFRFMPDMLRTLAFLEDGQSDEDDDLHNGDGNEFDFLHIHIRETKGVDGIIRISITLNKRHIPLNLFKDFEVRQPKTVFACSACASVYRTEEGLRLHQETECVLMEDKLTMDAEQNISYTIINTSRGKQYVCNVCNIVYTKLIQCEEHVRRHFKEANVPTENSTAVHTDNVNKGQGLFRCKMCNRAYLHAATLSKHIVSRHIKHMDVN